MITTGQNRSTRRETHPSYAASEYWTLPHLRKMHRPYLRYALAFCWTQHSKQIPRAVHDPKWREQCTWQCRPLAKLLKVKEPNRTSPERQQWRADHCSTHITYKHLNLRSKTDATHVSVLHTLLRITGQLTATHSTLFWGTRMCFSLNNTLLCVCVGVCVWHIWQYIDKWPTRTELVGTKSACKEF